MSRMDEPVYNSNFEGSSSDNVHVTEIHKISVTPGEVLVVRYDPALIEGGDLQVIAKQFQKAFGADSDKIIFLPKGMDLESVMMKKKQGLHPAYGE